jgi:hypothetical protein
MTTRDSKAVKAFRQLSPLQEFTLVSVLYLLLTAVLTYPTIVRLGTHIPGAGDAPRMVWDVWAFSRAITDPQLRLSTTDLIYQPVSNVPTLWEATPCLLLALPLEPILGPVVTYGLLFLLSFVLSGSLTFLLTRQLTASRTASFVAGSVFSFSVSHYAHGTSHLHMFSIQWLPLCALSLLLLWERRSVSRSLLLATAMALVVADTPYYALYFLAPVLVCFVGYQMWKGRSRLLKLRFLGGLVLALGVASTSALLVYPRLFFPQDETAEAIARVTGDTERYSADLVAYLIPSQTHPIFGELVAPVYSRFTAPGNAPEMTVYIGYTSLVLAVWGLRGGRRTHAGFWVLLALVSLVLSLGPVLHVNGKGLLTLPYAALMRLPLFGTLRAPSRAGITMVLAVAVLASCGLRNLLDRMGNHPKAKTAIGAVVLLAICFESFYALPYPTAATDLPAFYRQLSTDEQNTCFELPTGPGNHSSTAWYMLYQTYHGEKLAHGYVAREPLRVVLFPYWILRSKFLSPPVELFETDNWPAFEASFGDILAYNDIRFVVVQRQAGPFATAYTDEQYVAVRESLARSLGEATYEDDGLVAYENAPIEPQIRASFSGKLGLVDHQLVEATSCPDGASNCVYLVTYWQAGGVLFEKYGFHLEITPGGTDEVLVHHSSNLGYQFTYGDEVACYNTSWWAPGMVIPHYTLLPATDESGKGLKGAMDVAVWVADAQSGAVLDADSDHHPMDEAGHLLLDSYEL